MKSTIISILISITIYPIVNAHENHNHDIYSLQNSINKTKKTDNINNEKLQDKKNQTKSIDIISVEK